VCVCVIDAVKHVVCPLTLAEYLAMYVCVYVCACVSVFE